MRLVSARYRLLYRILVLSPKSTMSVTQDELIDADYSWDFDGKLRVPNRIRLDFADVVPKSIFNDLGIRASEYKIKAFKRHLRITRL